MTPRDEAERMAREIAYNAVGLSQKIMADLIADALTPILAKQAWRPIGEAPHMRKLLAAYQNALGKWRIVKACYYDAKTLELGDTTDWLEDGDEGFAPAGWYEESETRDDILPLDTPPTHFMELPSPPEASNDPSP